MAIFGINYPEIRDLISLFKRMGPRMPWRTMAEHCRMAAISIYDLYPIADEPYPGPFFVTANDNVWPIELHVIFGDESLLWPYNWRRYLDTSDSEHVLVLQWKPDLGLEELFNGPASQLRDALFKDNDPDTLAKAQAESRFRIDALGPYVRRDYLRGRKSERTGQEGGRNGRGGEGGPPGPASPGEPGGPGGGGMGEVLAHPVLFSASADYYRSLLENY